MMRRRLRLAGVIFGAAVLTAAGITAADPPPVQVAAAVVPAGTAGTVYACVTSSKTLSRVQVTGPPSCPSGSYPVSWAATVPGSPPPSPSPTPTSPSPSPTPTATPAAWAWCSTAPGGFMQFGGLALYAGEWNSSLPQKICGNSGSDWQATFSAPAGNTAILTYPDVQLNYHGSQPAVSSLDPAATSSFTETMNANPGTSAEAAYDIWLGNGAGGRDEVMIWTDTLNRGTVGGAAEIRAASFCGQDWQLWLNGASEWIWYLPGGEQSGTVCLAAMLQDLQAHGNIGAGDTLSQFEFGWEIASTGGQDETFQVAGYSVTGLPPGN